MILKAHAYIKCYLEEDDDAQGLILDDLTSAVGLDIPEGEGLSLNGLTSAVGLELPESVEWLSLDGLTSGVHITLQRGTSS